MRHIPTAVYIDTEVFVRNGLRFDTSDFRAIRETFVKGGLRLLVPKMMERELVRHFRRRARDIAEKVSNAHNEHPIRTLSLPLPSKPELEEQCFKALQKEWEDFKGHFTVEDLPLMGKLEDIVDWYFAIEAPFSSPKKEKEFPDAFILSALEEYFQLHSVRIAVVSFDGDFSTACRKRRDINHFLLLKDFIEAFAPEITKASLGEPIDPTKPIITEDLTEMKAILGRGSDLTVIERDRVLNLISTRGTNYEYFFRNAKEEFWLDTLRARGFFSNPPAVERVDGGIKVPLWWPMEFLVRVFEKDPEKVIAIVDSLPAVENPRILQSIVELILKSDDPDLVKKFYRQVEAYLETRLLSHQLIIKLLAKPYLLQSSVMDTGIALMTKIVGFLPDPEAKQKEMRRKEEPNDWTTSLTPSPRVPDWKYKEILKEGILPLAKREPFTIARILIDATASMIRLRMHGEQMEKSADEDGSELWCHRLDRLDSPTSDASIILVNTLTEACDRVYDNAPESIDALDQILRNQRWKLFKRLRQHLYALHPSDQTLPWIREFIFTHKDYGQWDHHHEFQRMLRTASEHFGNRLLTEGECTEIFNSILSGPSQEDFREWMGDGYSDEAWYRRKRYFHRKQFRPFTKLLFGTYRTYYDEVEKEFEADKLNDEDYSVMGKARSGTVSYRSPKSRDELVQLSDEALLTLINEWEEACRDSDDWLVEINISALAGAFQAVFKDLIISDPKRLAFWITNRERIERPIYVKVMVAAMRELTKEKQFEHLEQWLAFSEWVLDCPNEVTKSEEARSSDESRGLSDWRSCRREVGDFVGVCLDEDVQVPLSARAALAVLLQKLCTQFDCRLDNDRPVFLSRDSQVTEAINNTRSRAIESLVNFGYWLRRHQVAGDFPELKEILGARLADKSAIPFTLPENAILGLHFGQIWDLDKKWAVANKDRLFPKEQVIVWAEAFKAFLAFSQPFRPIFEVLREDFMFALEHLCTFDNARDMGRDIIDALGQHLFAYFLWEVYPLQGQNSLLSAFYDRTSGHREYWSHLFDHVGRTLRNTTPKLNEKLQERILAFFEWRLQEAEPSELNEFAFWLRAPCLAADWRLDAFLKILAITRSDDVHLSIELDTLNELLENHPAKVIECLAKITDTVSSEGYVYFPMEKTKPILLAGLKSVDESIRANAERARENLLKAKKFEFLDIK